MIELLGWAATAVVLAGFIVNSRGQHLLALALWLVGDIAWTIYDVCIDNYSHMVLSSAIIAINLYGYKNIKAKARAKILENSPKKCEPVTSTKPKSYKFKCKHCDNMVTEPHKCDWEPRKCRYCSMQIIARDIDKL